MKRLSIIMTSLSLVLLLSFSRPASDEIRKEVLKYTNDFRKTNKKSELIMNEDLNKLAEEHSEDMAKGKVGFGHEGFSDRAAKARKKLKDYVVAENVAMGVNSGKDAVELWEHSEGHRANLLGSFKYIGIGIARDKSGQVYYTQIFAD